jgi:hypothetical protein
VPLPITTAWLMRQDQGRQVLGSALRTMRADAAKRRVLQTLAGAFPCIALILEFTRCNDYRPDWRESTEEYKSERYRLLLDKMAASLPHGWTVETVCLTIGIRGSYAESQWSASLSALGISPAGVSSLMATLVSLCLAELNELYSVRSTALWQRADAQ